MKDKDLKKVPIMDMFDLLINSEETDSIIEAIRKERGKENVVETKQEELDIRLKTLSKLFLGKKDNNTE